MLLDKEMLRMKTDFFPDLRSDHVNYSETQKAKVFFKENEPQKPYEITEKPASKSRLSLTNANAYEYMNDADEKIYSKSFHTNSKPEALKKRPEKSTSNEDKRTFSEEKRTAIKTLHEDKRPLYEKIGGFQAIKQTVDLFYKKILADERVVGFYKEVDMERLHKHQANFLTKICGGPDHYTGRSMCDSHQSLHITDFHFDIVKNHLISSLQELKVQENFVEKIGELFEAARKQCVFQENSLENGKKCEDQRSLFEKIGGSDAISQTVDLFYKKILADKRIIGFYREVDMELLHKHQKNFLTKICGGPDHYTGRSMWDIHQKFYITDYHFDIVKNHLISSLTELKVQEDFIKEIGKLFEAARNQCVFKESSSENEKKCPHNKISLYEKIGGFEAISQTVDLFYKKILADKRIIGFYREVDMKLLHQHQKNFLTKICGGPDNYKGRTLWDSHKSLYITDFHFDIVKNHLISSLKELKVQEDFIEEIGKLFEGARNQCVFKESASENGKKCEQNKSSLFEKIGGSDAISQTVDLFYRKILADKRIIGFYREVDMELLHKHQKNFLTKICGGPDHYTGRSMWDSHQKLYITDYHFDIVKNHLISSLTELKVQEDLIEEIGRLFEGARNQCVFKENSLENGKKCEYSKEYSSENSKKCGNSNQSIENSSEKKRCDRESLKKSVISFAKSSVSLKKSSASEEESLRYLQEISSRSPQKFEQSLYLRMGGFDKITNLVEVFYDKQLSDPRIKTLYEGTDLTRLHHNLKYFFTKVFGGPDIFVGNSLRDCDQAMNNSSYYCEISFANLQKSSVELKISEENIKEMMNILQEKSSVNLIEPNNQTIYEMIGGYKTVSSLVDVFYRRFNESSPIEIREQFDKLKQNQKFFLTKIMGGPDTFLGENGMHFWKDPWLMKNGEKKWLENMEASLKEINVKKEVLEKVMEIFEKEILRK